MTLARAGLDGTTPLATATLVVAANAPDVDVLAYTQGEWFALACRRGITHGVPAMAVLPFAVAGAMAAWDRLVRRRRRPDAPPARFPALLLLSFVGVLTHPTLDWMNTYGMRWWMPFDDAWSYGDALFIIDPWLWLALGGAAALGGARTRGAALGWAALAALAALPVVLSGMVPPAARGIWIAGSLGIALAWWRSGSAAARGTPGARTALSRALTGAAVLYVGAMVGLSRAAEADVEEALRAAGMGVGSVMI